jgi:hypothetical protein
MAAPVTIGRVVAAALFIAGLCTGSAAHDDDHSPTFADGYWMIAADFHVHVFLGDGALMPWDIAREAARQGLDAVALTNHNQMIAADLAAWLPRPPGALLIPGDEITAPAFHMTAIGLEHAVDWRGSLPATAAAVHAQGAAAIVAHPAGIQRGVVDADAANAIDGIEVAHPMMDLDERDRRDLTDAYANARRTKPTIAPIGSTDFHVLAPIGLCRTYVFAHDVTQAAIVDAIRSGRTVACDSHGNVYGEPALARVAEPECQLSAHRRQTRSPLNQLALGCTWFGLVGLVFSAFPHRRP